VSTSAERPLVGLPAGVRLEPAACLFCAAAPTETVFQDPPFAVVRCTGCGLVFVSPRVAPDQIHQLYGASYWCSPAAKDYGYTDYRRDEPHWLRTWSRRAVLVSDSIGPGHKVLDVGCAAGFFLQVVQERGGDVFGVELSAPMATEAAARLGEDRVRVGTVSDIEPSWGPFDLITFWDVVEHIPDPVSALQVARRHLTPGGRLLVETQNVGSLFARLMGRRWQHFKQAEHLYHFSPSTVRRLFSASGLEVERLTARRTGKYVGLSFIAERAGKVHPVLSKALSPLAGVHDVAPYINLFDEMAVVGRSVGATD
jgi:SAM-dependent methyltransferase